MGGATTPTPFMHMEWGNKTLIKRDIRLMSLLTEDFVKIQYWFGKRNIRVCNRSHYKSSYAAWIPDCTEKERTT